MKIELKKIGMLDRAEFEVGDITLICGENNTGKTYATYSLYGYLDFMREIRRSFSLRVRIGLFDEELEIDKEEISVDKEIKLSDKELEDAFVKYIAKKAELFHKRAMVESMAGSQENFEHSRIKVEFGFKLSDIKKAIDIFSSSDYEEKLSLIRGCIIYDDGILLQLNTSNIIFQKHKEAFSQNARNEFFDHLLRILIPKNNILSVERTGASIFQNELKFKEIAQLKALKKIAEYKKMWVDVRDEFEEKTKQYAQPVRDNIEFIEKIPYISKRMSFIKQEKKQEILKTLSEILGGKYKATDAGILFQPKGSNKAYNIEIASSSVRSLLILNYYLLHQAQRGDILMIDEPELNLHPKNQILLARLFALLANEGIKIFVTTHSDYIVRELNNCIMLENLGDREIELFKKQGYCRHHKLKGERIRAYLAIKDKKTSTNYLKQMEVHPQQGIYIKTFDESIESQNENQGRIYNEVLKGLSSDLCNS